MNVLIAQPQGTAKNGLKLNSKSDMTGTANTTNTAGAHKHKFGNDGSGGTYAAQMNYGNYNSYTQQAGDHAHNIYLGSDDTETRPTDFTIKIWLRTA